MGLISERRERLSHRSNVGPLPNRFHGPPETIDAANGPPQAGTLLVVDGIREIDLDPIGPGRQQRADITVKTCVPIKKQRALIDPKNDQPSISFSTESGAKSYFSGSML
jgi:hypothetical protein